MEDPVLLPRTAGGTAIIEMASPSQPADRLAARCFRAVASPSLRERDPFDRFVGAEGGEVAAARERQGGRHDDRVMGAAAAPPGEGERRGGEVEHPVEVEHAAAATLSKMHAAAAHPRTSV